MCCVSVHVVSAGFYCFAGALKECLDACRWPVKKKQALLLVAVAAVDPVRAAVDPVRAPQKERPLKLKKKRTDECICSSLSSFVSSYSLLMTNQFVHLSSNCAVLRL